MIAVDTNVLVYAVDSNETVKGPRAVELLETLSLQPTLLLWQVVCEFGAALHRRQSRDQVLVEVPIVLNAWLDVFPLAMPSRAVVMDAWKLRTEFQVAYWDAMLLAACREAGVRYLYTEDVQFQKVVGGVEIVNPFQ